MSCQVRHPEYGIFQGECMGLGFWHPMSEMPEQGICEFASAEDARLYVERHCAYTGESPAAFVIEPYDKALCLALRHTLHGQKGAGAMLPC